MSEHRDELRLRWLRAFAWFIRNAITFAFLLMAVASGGQYAIATTQHNFHDQLWALLTGASFLMFAIVRLIDDLGRGK